MNDRFHRRSVFGKWIVMSIVALMSGCGTLHYSGVEPITPKMTTAPNFASKLKNGELEFQWKPHAGAEKYDLQIWEMIVTTTLSPGKVVYYKEGIEGTSHRADVELTPGDRYFWSVRPTGAKTWSSATASTLNPGYSEPQYDKWFFVFRVAKE